MRPLSDLYDRGVYGAVLIAEAIRNARRLAGRRHGAAGQHEQPAAVDDVDSGDLARPTLHGVVLQKAIPCPSPLHGSKQAAARTTSLSLALQFLGCDLRQQFHRLDFIGISERVVDYMPTMDIRELPALQRKKAQPNGTRSITQAVINAAIRHGSDGRGKDGLQGYFLLLERMDPPIFDMLTRTAQWWQIRHPPPSPKPDKQELDLSFEEYHRAILDYCWRYRGVPEPDWDRANPYPDPESDDEGLIEVETE
jgi:hypothetical protein